MILGMSSATNLHGTLKVNTIIQHYFFHIIFEWLSYLWCCHQHRLHRFCTNCSLWQLVSWVLLHCQSWLPIQQNNHCQLHFYCLTLITFTFLWANSADSKLVMFCKFSQKIAFYISCKWSPKETICMKCKMLFSGKKRILQNIVCWKFYPSCLALNLLLIY